MKNQYYTDIQLKALSRRIIAFNMKIIMRRNSDIFNPENIRIGNAGKAVPFKLELKISI